MSAAPTSEPRAWSTTARNLAEHASNTIHTDEGARAQGFPSALVAGVTTYAYLTHPIVEAWGLDWLGRGGGEVRFRAPVFADATVECRPTANDEGVLVAATCADVEPNPRVTFQAVRDSGPAPATRPGERLPSRQFTLGEHFLADYGERAGDDLDVYSTNGIMHPVTWPMIANDVFSSDLVKGPWIHTRSIIRHHGPGPIGAVVDVHATVVERFQRRGHRAIVDLRIELDGRPIATLEHEAIVELPGDG